MVFWAVDYEFAVESWEILEVDPNFGPKFPDPSWIFF